MIVLAEEVPSIPSLTLVGEMVCRRRRSECSKTLQHRGQFWNEELEQLWGLGAALWHRLCEGRLLAVAFGWGSACI